MDESVYVDTRCGKLRGLIIKSPEAYDYCSFKGVPYAKPPIGNLRFKDPIPLEPWTGVRDATNFGSMCLQYDLTNRLVQGSDDCLYLNVYVKSVNPENKLPVMVWIHGGAFVYGSSDDFLYGPDYILKKDVVLVTCNYRVGILGFLNFEDEVAPGNQGLKDQIMVLKWVQENITQFGGDVNNVTLFGQSAGASSVHYLALSNLTKGLFHKVIVQSGAACNTWACSSNKSSSYKIAKHLGCKSKDPKELVEFLRTIECHKLIEAQERIRSFEDKLRSIFSFGPGIDAKSKTPVMPIHPLQATKKGIHVPMIVGCTNREGIIALIGISQAKYEELDKNFEYHLTDVTKQMLRRNNITASKLKQLYFGSKKIIEENTHLFVDMWSDINFIDGIHRIIEAQVKNCSTPTYFYQFTYDKDFSITKSMSKSTLSGASHFDEVQYLFYMKFFDLLNFERPKSGSAGHRIKEQMVEMWYNFAKYGKPTPVINDLITTSWLPVINEKVFRTLNINENLQMENTLNLDERLKLGVGMKNKL